MLNCFLFLFFWQLPFQSKYLTMHLNFPPSAEGICMAAGVKKLKVWPKVYDVISRWGNIFEAISLVKNNLIWFKHYVCGRAGYLGHLASHLLYIYYTVRKICAWRTFHRIDGDLDLCSHEDVNISYRAVKFTIKRGFLKLIF